MRTTKQKPVIDAQKIERNLSTPQKMLLNQKGREQEKKGTERNYKTDK